MNECNKQADMNEDRLAYDRSLRLQAMEWAASTASGGFLHPDLVIERAEEFIGYVQNGWARSDAAVAWTPPKTDDLQLRARKIVWQQIQDQFGDDPSYQPGDFGIDNVYVVWFSKTLQNWKALVSTTVSDGLYWEVTYDGDLHTAYVDRYVKQTNTLVHG